MSSLAATRAKRTATHPSQKAAGHRLRMNSFGLLMKYGHGLSSAKTLPVSVKTRHGLRIDSPTDWNFSVIPQRLLKSGRAVWALTTNGTEHSCSVKLPTPTASQMWKPLRKLCPSENRGGRHGVMLIAFLGERNPQLVGNWLNPTFAERLMGWPIGWTDLRPLEMDKFRRWLELQDFC